MERALYRAEPGCSVLAAMVVAERMVAAERERCLTLAKNMADHAYNLHRAIESEEFEEEEP